MKSKVRMIFDPRIKGFFAIGTTDQQRWDDWWDEKASTQDFAAKQWAKATAWGTQNKKQQKSALEISPHTVLGSKLQVVLGPPAI